jgi:hypothetical protein
MHGSGLLVQVYNSIYHNDSVIVVSSYSTSTSERLDGARTGRCSHLSVVAGEHRGLYPPSGCSQRIWELELPSGCSLRNKGVGASFQLQLENKGSWCFQ